MKKLPLLILFIAAQAFAPTLEWDANTETNLAGYKVYSGTKSRQYSTAVDVGNRTLKVVPDQAFGTKKFYAVTAYDTDGLENDFSNEVSWTERRLRWQLPAGRWLVESTFELLNPIAWLPWETVTGPKDYWITVDTTLPAHYFRATLIP